MNFLLFPGAHALRKRRMSVFPKTHLASSLRTPDLDWNRAGPSPALRARRTPASRGFALVGICIGWLLLAGAVNAQDAVRSELLQPQGVVEVLRAGDTVWVKATNSVTLHPGDIVRTGPDSRAAIRLSNASMVRLDAQSRLQLRPASKSEGVLLHLLRGASYFFHRERPARTEFETPLVSGAIRGTEFLLQVDDNGQTLLSLFEGAVDLTNQFGALALTTGDQSTIAPQQPPRRTARLEGQQLLQWCLYYPAVLDPDELSFNERQQQALAASLEAYRAGDLPSAIDAYPAGREPENDPERIYLAALRLAAGQVAGAETLLEAVTDNANVPNSGMASLVRALRALIAAVVLDPVAVDAGADSHDSASLLLALSYQAQARQQLAFARQLARAGAERAPRFAAAWARVAEMEFSFGRTMAAREAIERALALAPRHAHAFVLRGFLLAAAHDLPSAIAAFDQAIRIDAALGNAWLGRGLGRIRQGDSQGGLEDLVTAAALEPNRAVLRSYLGKAWDQTGDETQAAHELGLARQLDPSDPTAWLYSALFRQRQNRNNDALRDLERSRQLNDHRSLYRSRFLLDQDQAVRSANLANLYRDAGLEDVAVRAAARAVHDDYANHSAHLFLAESLNLQRAAGQSSLRTESAIFSELLVANLLAPPGAGLLSRTISEQDYARLFERDGFGGVSVSEYRSSGDWLQNVSQFGNSGALGYAVDGSYLRQNGSRPNNDLESIGVAAAFKARVSERDSLYLQSIHSSQESGDLRQVYHPSQASRTFRVDDAQPAQVLAGWHRAWHPGSHTLALIGRLQDNHRVQDDAWPALTLFKTNGVLSSVSPPGLRQFDSRLRGKFEAWSGEIQQIWQGKRHTMVAGARYQSGENETRSELEKVGPSVAAYPSNAVRVSTSLRRAALYAYENWRITRSVAVLAGLTYDHLTYPENVDLPPVNRRERSKDQLSPKLGLVWTPGPATTARAVYTRSLGGLYYDNSVRLEPAQFGGFVQAYRSLLPDSVAGVVAGSEFETGHVELEHRFASDTWLALRGELLESKGRRAIGVFDVDALSPPLTAVATSTREQMDFREKALVFSAGQLLDRDWSLGLRYRVAEARLDQRLAAIPSSVYTQAESRARAVLQQLHLAVNYQHPSGFHSQLQSLWSAQDNSGALSGQPGDDFWQFNLMAGWRFWRRHVDVTIGLLNLTDRNYRLDPLTLYQELPRERTLFASVRWSF